MMKKDATNISSFSPLIINLQSVVFSLDLTETLS